MIKVIVLGILIISSLFANNIYKYDEVEHINDKYYEVATKKLANGYWFWHENMNSMLPLKNGEVNGVSFQYLDGEIGLVTETYYRNKIQGTVIDYYKNMNIAKIMFYYPNKFEEKDFLQNGNLLSEIVINNKKGFIKRYKDNEIWLEATIEVDIDKNPELKILEAYEYKLSQKIKISNEEFLIKAKMGIYK